MADFTTTTNFALKKPTVGQAVDLWGTYINSNFDEIDSQLQTLTVSIQTPDLEGLGNVLNTTPATNDFLRFNGESWKATTVTIPSSIDDLSDVDTSTTAPTTGQALVWSGSSWTPSTPTAATIADASITTAKLDSGLQTQIGRILVTDDDDTPTNGQILQYSTADTEWKYADLPGSTLVTLGDVDSAALADNALLVYNSSAGEFQFESGSTLRSTLGVDVAGTDNSTDITISSATSYDYITLSAGQVLTLNQVDLQTDVANTLPVSSGGTGSTTASAARTALGVSIGSDVQSWDQQLDDISALAVTDGNIIVGNGTTWVAESGATARESLGLTIGTDVQAYDADTAKYDDTTANFTGTLQNGGSNVVVDSDIGSSVQAYDADTAKYDDTTANFTGTLQNGGSNVLVDLDIGSTVQAAGSYLTSVDLTSNVTGTLPVANGGTGVTSLSSLDAADLGSNNGVSNATDGYVLTADGTGGVAWEAVSGGGGGGLSDLEHANSVSTAETISSGNHRFYVGPVSFSNTVTIAGKMLVLDGLLNTTGTINITGTLSLR